MIKQILLRLYYWANLSKERSDANQRVIRDVEWQAIEPYITPNSKFLDVGCGAGYAMRKAAQSCGCQCTGVDPNPGEHGVGRYNPENMTDLQIIKAFSELLPLPSEHFDVVYCSHVLEHVQDEIQSLREMKRVLKPGGVLIIGMPTASMAFISLISEMLFTTHQRVLNVLLRPFPFITTGRTPLINMFIPHSHSAPRARTVFYDLHHYRVSNWKATVETIFDVQQTILPALYPYPQYIQFFPMLKNFYFSSSVFFICRHKK